MADKQKTWYCKIGEGVPQVDAADGPMRQAVARAYEEITGEEPDFIFSGWGAKLTEAERAVVEDRLPIAPVGSDLEFLVKMEDQANAADDHGQMMSVDPRDLSRLTSMVRERMHEDYIDVVIHGPESRHVKGHIIGWSDALSRISAGDSFGGVKSEIDIGNAVVILVSEDER